MKMIERNSKLLYRGNWHDGNACHSYVLGHERIDTSVTAEDIANGIEMDKGMIYSPDGKKLLKAKGLYNEDVKVQEGTEIICDGALSGCGATSIDTGNTVIAIGAGALSNNGHLQSVTIGKKVKYIANVNPFGSVKYVPKHFICRSPYLHEKDGILYTADKTICYGIVRRDYTHDLDLPDPVIIIGCGAFWFATNLKSLYMHDNVVLMGNGSCSNSGLQQVSLSHSLHMLPEFSFEYCEMENMEITENVDFVGNGALSHNPCLKSLTIDGYHVDFEHDSLSDCDHLQDITGPAKLKCFKRGGLQNAGIHTSTIRRTTMIQHTTHGDERMTCLHLG